MMKPVLVLSGHVVSLAIARSLAPARIPVFVASYDDRDMAPASRFVCGTYRVPHPEFAEDRLLERLEELGRLHHRPVLMPADDRSLVLVSRHRERLEKSLLVACADSAAVERLIDKRNTYTAAGSAGVPVPVTVSPASARECAEAAAAVGFPCLVKPATSHNYSELLGVKYRRVTERPEAHAAFEEAARIGVRVMVQEWVPGGDECGVNYNAYVADGIVRVEFTARKVRMVPPGAGVPGVVVSEQVHEAIEPGRRILAAIGFNGFACCEFKRDPRTGVYKLLEVNGRHNRSALLATRCGINFPLIEYEHLVLNRVPERLTFTTGRYWIDEFKDLTHLPQRLRLDPRTALTFWRPYLRPPVCAVFAWSDPGPFAHRVGKGIQAAGRKLFSPHRPAVTATDLGKPSEIPHEN